MTAPFLRMNRLKKALACGAVPHMSCYTMPFAKSCARNGPPTISRRPASEPRPTAPNGNTGPVATRMRAVAQQLVLGMGLIRLPPTRRRGPWLAVRAGAIPPLNGKGLGAMPGPPML